MVRKTVRGMDRILNFLFQREKLGKDSQVVSPPFPRDWENLPGQHLERGNCPPDPAQHLCVCVCVHEYTWGVRVLHASPCPSPLPLTNPSCQHLAYICLPHLTRPPAQQIPPSPPSGGCRVGP